MTAWIKMIQDEDADEELTDALDMARAPQGGVGNVMRVHSLRPSTMRGHAILYNAVLHDDRNTLPLWLQETLGSYVSLMNDCTYSYTNHWANARHLIANNARADKIERALQDRQPETMFDGSELALIQYAEKLTLEPGLILKAHVDMLKEAGLDDGQILEANQLICYFNYVNRVLNGLGVAMEGDKIGYYSE